MPQQLTFDLPGRAALGRDDFYVSPANAVAVATVTDWAHWPNGKLVLAGQTGSGKTHLAHVWAVEAAATVVPARDLTLDRVDTLAAQSHVVIEDVPLIAGQAEPEQALFHLHNLLQAGGGALLLTGTDAPTRWRLALPDLASRMQGTSVVTLDPPDDALLAAVLLKLFSDRQLAVSPALIGYLLRRMERSFAAAQTIVQTLDQRALREGRAIGQSMAAEVLDNLERGDA
ncbi:chromosomal replication initiator DnaA [Pseudogemmobacter sp. W21_MBD1_M6]|uniref:chromosomal replication initiator DnaA n=1 Tax=Pseudogemmobacter sp. W21_MBD1_M6 TaxID=3240271 RepID=UPI003F985C38